MKIKTWVTIAVVYLVVVISAYGLITGENIFQSGDLHEDHESLMNHHDEKPLDFK